MTLFKRYPLQAFCDALLNSLQRYQLLFFFPPCQVFVLFLTGRIRQGPCSFTVVGGLDLGLRWPGVVE